MKRIRYFFQFLVSIFTFLLFKILGAKLSSKIGGIIFEIIGPYFRSKKLIHSNIKKAFPDIDQSKLNRITKMMWNNYGRVFAEYMFIKDFRSGKLNSKIKIEGQEILDQIKEFKEKILSGEIPLAELGNPTSVKKLDKYSGRKPRAGEMFTEIEKGCPAPVRAAIKYNDLLTFWGLDKNYNLITAYDKVKWTYLKDNPYKIEALAFLDYEMPPKIEEFFNQYADRKKIFDSILLNKLEGFFSDIGWSLDTNPYINAFKMLEV